MTPLSLLNLVKQKVSNQLIPHFKKNPPPQQKPRNRLFETHTIFFLKDSNPWNQKLNLFHVNLNIPDGTRQKDMGIKSETSPDILKNHLPIVME